MWPRQRHEVRIAQPGKFLGYLPVYFADHKGYFDQQGLAVKFLNAYGDHSTWDMVAQGHAEFGIADPLLMLDSTQPRGLVVASVVQRAGIYGLTRHTDFVVSSSTDFSGKRLAAFEAPSTSFALANHIRLECVQCGVAAPEIIQIKFTSELGYIDRPDIDVVLMTEPSATIAELGGARRVYNASAHFGDLLVTALFSTAEYVAKHRELTQSLVSGIQRSMSSIHADHLEALRMAGKRFPELPPIAVELGTLRLIADGVIPDRTTVSEEGWYRLRTLRDRKSPMPSIHDYVDQGFAIRAWENAQEGEPGLLILRPTFMGVGFDALILFRILRRWFRARRQA